MKEMDRNYRSLVAGAPRDESAQPLVSPPGAPATRDLQVAPPHCHPLEGSHCATCADEGVEVLVLNVRDDSIAVVEMEGPTGEVAIDLLDGVRAGDRLLVHAGVAIARVEMDGAAHGGDGLGPRLRGDDGRGQNG